MNFSYQKTKRPRQSSSYPTTLPKEIISKIEEYLPRQAKYRGKGFVRMVHGLPKYYPVRDPQNLPPTLRSLWHRYDPNKEFILVSDRRLTDSSLFVVIPFSGSNSIHREAHRDLKAFSNRKAS